jgi:hypothetical protein
VSFKYERLPNFYYWCGLLTHDEKECEIWLRSKGSLSAVDHQYGTWLRGDSECYTGKTYGFFVKNRHDHRHRTSNRNNHGDTGMKPTPVNIETLATSKLTEKESLEVVMTIPKISPISNQMRSTFEEHLQEIDKALEPDNGMEIFGGLHGNNINVDSVFVGNDHPKEVLAEVASDVLNFKHKKAGPTWKRVRPKHMDMLQDVPIFSITGSKRPNPKDFHVELITAPDAKKVRGVPEQGVTNGVEISAAAGVQPRHAQ